MFAWLTPTKSSRAPPHDHGPKGHETSSGHTMAVPAVNRSTMYCAHYFGSELDEFGVLEGAAGTRTRTMTRTSGRGTTNVCSLCQGLRVDEDAVLEDLRGYFPPSIEQAAAHGRVHELENFMRLIANPCDLNISTILQGVETLQGTTMGKSGNALCTAAYHGQEEVAVYLLGAGFPVGMPEGKEGKTPLQCAVIKGHRRLVRLLVRHGASDTTRIVGGAFQGMCALDVAVVMGRPDLATLVSCTTAFDAAKTKATSQHTSPYDVTATPVIHRGHNDSCGCGMNHLLASARARSLQNPVARVALAYLNRHILKTRICASLFCSHNVADASQTDLQALITLHNEAALVIQRCYQNYRQRKYLPRVNAAASRVQACWRGFVARSRYSTVRVHAATLATHRRVFDELLAAVASDTNDTTKVVAAVAAALDKWIKVDTDTQVVRALYVQRDGGTNTSSAAALAGTGTGTGKRSDTLVPARFFKLAKAHTARILTKPSTKHGTTLQLITNAGKVSVFQRLHAAPLLENGDGTWVRLANPGQRLGNDEAWVLANPTNPNFATLSSVAAETNYLQMSTKFINQYCADYDFINLDVAKGSLVSSHEFDGNIVATTQQGVGVRGWVPPDRLLCDPPTLPRVLARCLDEGRIGVFTTVCKEADLTQRLHQGNTIFHICAEANAVLQLRVLLAADVARGSTTCNCPNDNVETPLMVACASASMEAVDVLLAAGCDVGYASSSCLLWPVGGASAAIATGSGLELEVEGGDETENHVENQVRVKPAHVTAYSAKDQTVTVQLDDACLKTALRGQTTTTTLALDSPRLHPVGWAAATHHAVLELPDEIPARLASGKHCWLEYETWRRAASGSPALQHWSMPTLPLGGGSISPPGSTIDGNHSLFVNPRRLAAPCNSAFLNGKGMCAISIAAERRSVALLAKLCAARGVDVNAQDNGGFTPLMRVLHSIPAITPIVQPGSEVLAAATNAHSAVDDHAASPWSFFARASEPFKECSKEGTDNDTRLRDCQVHAAQDCISTLVLAGGHVNQPGKRGTTPLMLASLWKDASLAQHLLSLGADMSLVDDAGDDALQIAASHGNDTTVQALLQHSRNCCPSFDTGARVNKAMQAAAAAGNTATLLQLVQSLPINAVGCKLMHKVGYTPSLSCWPVPITEILQNLLLKCPAESAGDAIEAAVATVVAQAQHHVDFACSLGSSIIDGHSPAHDERLKALALVTELFKALAVCANHASGGTRGAELQADLGRQQQLVRPATLNAAHVLVSNESTVSLLLLELALCQLHLSSLSPVIELLTEFPWALLARDNQSGALAIVDDLIHNGLASPRKTASAQAADADRVASLLRHVVAEAPSLLKSGNRAAAVVDVVLEAGPEALSHVQVSLVCDMLYHGSTHSPLPGRIAAAAVAAEYETLIDVPAAIPTTTAVLRVRPRGPWQMWDKVLGSGLIPQLQKMQMDKGAGAAGAATGTVGRKRAAATHFLKMWCPELLAKCTICDTPFDDVSAHVLACKKNTHEHFQKKFCEHAFCQDCMKAWIHSKLDDQSASIQCPEPGCEVLLFADDVRRIAGAAACDRFVALQSADHRARLLELLRDQPALVKTLSKDAKPCPKCYVIIYRHAGCDSMMCRCSHRFSWNSVVKWPTIAELAVA